MRKNVFGRQYKRDANERKSLFKGLMSALVMYGKIETTLEKAKGMRGRIEKLVTKARKGGADRGAFDMFLTPLATQKLISTIAPVFATRPGGYTRIIRTSKRVSDNAQKAVIEWVEVIPEQKVEVKTSKKRVKIEEVKKPVIKKAVRKVTKKATKK